MLKTYLYPRCGRETNRGQKREVRKSIDKGCGRIKVVVGKVVFGKKTLFSVKKKGNFQSGHDQAEGHPSHHSKFGEDRSKTVDLH